MGLCGICVELLGSTTSRKIQADDRTGTVPSTMHASWKALCSSIEKNCFICWTLWRHIRPSPLAVAHQENRIFTSRWKVVEGYGKEEGWSLTSIWLLYELGGGREQLVTLIPVPPPTNPLGGGLGSPYTGLALERNPALQQNNKPDSNSSASQIQAWISYCSNNHKQCHKRKSLLPAAIGTDVPTRLLDLDGVGPQTWSLRVTHGVSEKYSSYVALSHRWTESVPQLKKGNFDQLQNGRPDGHLPKDYQNAIALCRALGVQFLWIDSLCIFQDSPEDFRREAAAMASVYMNALCTLSICWSSSPGGSCQKRNDSSLLPPVIPTQKIPIFDHYTKRLFKEDAVLYDIGEWERAILNAPINHRGWVFQERILSSRVLYLGNDQLYWECDQMRASEVFPSGMPRHTMDTSHTDLHDARERVIKEEDDDWFHRGVWPGLVERYTRSNLTFEADRLIAFSGVARILSQREPSDYVAGLWRSQLLASLHWDQLDPLRSPGGTSDYTAPSWSWASSSGPVEYDTHARSCYFGSREPGSWSATVCEPLARLSDVSVALAGQDPFGSITSGFMDIQPLVIPVQLLGNGRRSDSQTRSITAEVYVRQNAPAIYWHSLSCYGPKIVLNQDLHAPEAPKQPCFLIPLLAFSTLKGYSIQGLIIQGPAENVPSTNPSRASDSTALRRIGTFRDDVNDGLLAKCIVTTMLKFGHPPKAEGRGTAQDDAEHAFHARLQAFLQSTFGGEAADGWASWLRLMVDTFEASIGLTDIGPMWSQWRTIRLV